MGKREYKRYYFTYNGGLFIFQQGYFINNFVHAISGQGGYTNAFYLIYGKPTKDNFKEVFNKWINDSVTRKDIIQQYIDRYDMNLEEVKNYKKLRIPFLGDLSDK